MATLRRFVADVRHFLDLVRSDRELLLTDGGEVVMRLEPHTRRDRSSAALGNFIEQGLLKPADPVTRRVP